MFNPFRKKDSENFKFKEARNTACFTCAHVLNGDPILFVSHDEDGAWQFLCGRDGHPESDAKIVGLAKIVDIDPSVNELYEMPQGIGANRDSATEKWKPYRLS